VKVLRKRVSWANQLAQHETQLIAGKNQIAQIQTQVAALKILIDADPDAPQSDKDFMATANNLMTNPTVQAYIDLITNQVG
jgi:hypothetical protein